ncbi:MAG: hypothetical protein ACKOX3_07145 [Bacteroidota bacterium]
MTKLNQELIELQKSLFATIASKSKEWEICKTYYDTDNGIYCLDIALPNYFKNEGLPNSILQIQIALDFKKITENYHLLKIKYPENVGLSIQKIIDFDPATMNYDFDEKFYFSKAFEAFLHGNWHKIISHLKQFNFESDNYEEIAHLLHLYRGGVIGNKFGL